MTKWPQKRPFKLKINEVKQFKIKRGMKSTQRFSVLIWADKRKTDVNGNVPLYARITYLGKRVEISLQRKIDPKKWDAQAGFLKGPGPNKNKKITKNKQSSKRRSCLKKSSSRVSVK